MTVLNRPLFRQAGGPVDGPAQAMPEEDDINRQIRAELENEPSSIAKMGGGDIDEAVRLGRSLYDTEMALRRLKELERAPQRNRREIQEVSREIQALQQIIKNSGLRQSDIRSLEIDLMPEGQRGSVTFLPSEHFGIEKRAMGGEMMASEQMMAPPPPQTMAPGPAPMPPGADVVQQTEQMAAAQGQKIGQDYAQRMMEGIDQAQSTEELINAFRGNEMPLEARRDELAGYVGEGDADQTPESVLAMVQPVIMMTEEGAMNSGIGNLMQQLTGDIDMMTEAGAPTDMGQGVGSLMMAGAPEAPAPQNFRQGGEVAYLDDGSNETATAPSDSYTQAEFLQALEGLAGNRYSNLGFKADNVSKLYSEKLLPLFNEITDQDERAAEEAEARQFDKTLALASLGQAGLRLAAGDPKAGGSFASQLAAAFQPTAGELAALGAGARKRRSDIRAEDRALRTAALQGAMGIEQQAASDRLALEEAKIRARVKNYNPVTYVKPIEDDTTTPEVESGLDFRTVDPRDSKDVADAKKAGFVPESVYKTDMGRDAEPVIKGVRQEDGSVKYVNVNSEAGQNEIASANAAGREILNLGTEKPKELALVTVKGEDYNSMDDGLTYIIPGQKNPVTTPPDALIRKGEDRNKYIKTKDRKKRYELVRDAFYAASLNNPDFINFDPAGDLAGAFGADELRPGTLQVVVNEQGEPTNETNVAGTVVPATNVITASDYKNILDLVVPNVFKAAGEGTGPQAAFDAFIDSTFAGFFTSEDGAIANTQEARQTLRALMILTRSALVDNDRYAVREMEAIGSLFADPDTFFANPATQKKSLQQLKQMLVNRYMGLIEEASTGFQGMSDSKISAKQQKLSQTAAALRLFRNVPIEYSEKTATRALQLNAVRAALRGTQPQDSPQDAGGP